MTFAHHSPCYITKGQQRTAPNIPWLEALVYFSGSKYDLLLFLYNVVLVTAMINVWWNLRLIPYSSQPLKSEYSWDGHVKKKFQQRTEKMSKILGHLEDTNLQSFISVLWTIQTITERMWYTASMFVVYLAVTISDLLQISGETISWHHRNKPTLRPEITGILYKFII